MAAPSKRAPDDVPDPIIYGPTFPDLRLVMKDGRQSIESRTNANLRVEGRFDDKGTFDMWWLLVDSPLCDQRHGECGEWCPLVAEQTDGWHAITHGAPRIDQCPELQRLLAALRPLPRAAGSTRAGEAGPGVDERRGKGIASRGLPWPGTRAGR